MRIAASGILLGLAWFAAINIATSAIAWLLSALQRPAGARASDHAVMSRLLPSLSAGLRLLPALTSTLFVIAIFLPAHFWFEPVESDESFGILLSTLAAIGLLLGGRGVWRGSQVAMASARLRAGARRAPLVLSGRAVEVADLPGVSLAGVFRPRVLIGAAAQRILTPPEIEVALAHERAHLWWRDNVVRAAMFCAPDCFGWTRRARQLEERWRAEVEYRADAQAAGGDGARAMVLASALVKVARLSAGPRRPPAAQLFSAFHDPDLLETRVRRLVDGPPPSNDAPRRLWVAWPLLMLATSVSIWVLDLAYPLHLVTETLISRLP